MSDDKPVGAYRTQEGQLVIPLDEIGLATVFHGGDVTIDCQGSVIISGVVVRRSRSTDSTRIAKIVKDEGE